MVEPTPKPKIKSSEKRILVIDDDEAILMLMKTHFEIEGFQVKTAKDGRAIQKLASEYNPDLILTDLMMPGVGGYDVLRELQGDPLTSKTPVLLITGSHMNESTKAMLKSEPNMAGYFEKPVLPATVLLKVHKLLNTISAADQRAEHRKEYPVNFNDVF